MKRNAARRILFALQTPMSAAQLATKLHMPLLGVRKLCSRLHRQDGAIQKSGTRQRNKVTGRYATVWRKKGAA